MPSLFYNCPRPSNIPYQRQRTSSTTTNVIVNEEVQQRSSSEFVGLRYSKKVAQTNVPREPKDRGPPDGGP